MGTILSSDVAVHKFLAWVTLDCIYLAAEAGQGRVVVEGSPAAVEGSRAAVVGSRAAVVGSRAAVVGRWDTVGLGSWAAVGLGKQVAVGLGTMLWGRHCLKH